MTDSACLIYDTFYIGQNEFILQEVHGRFIISEVVFPLDLVTRFRGNYEDCIKWLRERKEQMYDKSE